MSFKRTDLALSIFTLVIGAVFAIAFLVDGTRDVMGYGSVFLYALSATAFLLLADLLWMWRQQIVERPTQHPATVRE